MPFLGPSVKLRTVEQFSKDQRDLLLNNARPIVLHADLEAVVPGRFDDDPNFRNDARLFAGVERVIDGFLNGREQRLSGIVESEQMPVLRKELADGDIPLLRRHRLGGDPAAAFLLGR